MTSTEQAARAEIQAEHIATMLRLLPSIIIAQLAANAVFVGLLWRTASHAHLLSWSAVFYVVVVLRWLLLRRYREQRPSPQEARRWGLASAALSAAFGLVWGATPMLFMDPAHPTNLIMVTVLLVGMSGGSMVVLSPYPLAYVVFVAPVLTPLVIVLLLRYGSLGVGLASLVAFAVLAYLSVSRAAHRVFHESLRLRFENIALRREAEEKSRLLETLLQNIRHGIGLADNAGRLRLWNENLLKLLGLTPGQVGNGRSLDTLLQALDPPLPQPCNGRIEYRRADDTVIEILQNPLPDGGLALTCADISHSKRREAALEQARLSAERANAAKTRFLAAASHDLRQPLHALGLFFGVLADRVRAADTEPLLRQVEDAIDAINNMLNALLDISKLDAGVIYPTIGPVAIADLFSRLENEFLPVAQETGNRLRVRPCRQWVCSDGAMLERILRNLISNALRYTHNGRVLVAGRRRGAALRIAVYDTGVGIPEQHLDEIFDEFHQLGNPERDRRQGLGLGLSIVKRLAGLLEHDVRVRSRVGHGSCFSILAPLTAAQAPVCAAPPAAAAPAAALQGRRVLVLDDDHAVLTAMRRLLEHWGCQVTVAASLEEAQARLPAVAPDLLLVDYRLRGAVSGVEAIRALQQRLERQPPAVMITGDTAPDRLREAQASGYPLLHKPVQPARLRSVMRHLLG